MSSFKEKEAAQLFDDANTKAASGDFSTAVDLLQKASNLGHVQATTNLAICNYYGDGCQKNISVAKSLFSKAERENDIVAVFYLGIIARDEQNGKEAVLKLTKAAECGMADAQHELGELYITGEQIGVKRDFRRAIHWFAYAAQQGHEIAQAKFQLLYYHGHEEEETVTGFWFEREQMIGQKIPCSVPYSVSVRNGEYIVDGFSLQ